MKLGSLAASMYLASAAVGVIAGILSLIAFRAVQGIGAGAILAWENGRAAQAAGTRAIRIDAVPLAMRVSARFRHRW